MNLSGMKREGALETPRDLLRARALLWSEEEAKKALPWIARLALGIGAWLAGIFLVGFFWLVLDMMSLDEEWVFAVVGVFLIGGCVFLLRLGSGVFLEQLALALGMSGHLLFFFGLHDVVSGNEFAGPLFGAVVLVGPVYWFSQHFVQRFLSVAWVWLTWWGASLDFWSGDTTGPIVLGLLLAELALVITLLWGIERLSRPLWRPILWASVSALFISLFWLASLEPWDAIDFEVARYFGAVAAIALIVTLWIQVKPEGRARMAILGLGVLMLALGVAGAPGIVVSLGLMAIAHARFERMLEYAAIAFLGVFLIAFYYHLGLPLITKSLTLMAAGIILLVFRGLLGRFGGAPTSGEADAGAERIVKGGESS